MKNVERIKAAIAFLFKRTAPVMPGILLCAVVIFFLVVKSIILSGFLMNKFHTVFSWNRAYDVAMLHKDYYVFPIVILCSLCFLFKNRSRLYYLFVLNLILSFLFLVDVWYFRAFSALPTPVVIKQFANLENLSSSVFGMMRIIDIVFIADLFLCAGALFFFKQSFADRRRIVPSAILVGLSMFILMAPAYRQYRHGVNVLSYPLIDLYDQAVTAFNLSPIGYHLYSVYDYKKNSMSLSLGDEEMSQIEQWLDEKEEKIRTEPHKGIFTGKNLIMIQYESLENFVIKQRVGGAEITPALNRLLSHSLYFSDFHEQVRDGNSSDAEYAVNASVYPLRRGSTNFMYPYAAYAASLPRLFKQKSYSTLAAHADHGSFWNWRAVLSSMGYDECIDVSHFVMDDFLIFGLSDRSYFRQMIPLIEKRDQPFFVYFATISSHIPFIMPDTVKGLPLVKDFDATVLGSYYQSMHYTDAQIGMLFEALDKKGILESTVVVIYGDHEGVHKYYPAELEKIKPREEWWYSNHKRVPLIIYYKGMKGREYSVAGGQVDLLPTLAYLFNLGDASLPRKTLGRNLLTTGKSFVLDADGTVAGSADAALKRHAVSGMDISEKIIRSGYFGR
jgi:lipoteichoic acid synthase